MAKVVPLRSLDILFYYGMFAMIAFSYVLMEVDRERLRVEWKLGKADRERSRLRAELDVTKKQLVDRNKELVDSQKELTNRKKELTDIKMQLFDTAQSYEMLTKSFEGTKVSD